MRQSRSYLPDRRQIARCAQFVPRDHPVPAIAAFAPLLWVLARLGATPGPTDCCSRLKDFSARLKDGSPDFVTNPIALRTHLPMEWLLFQLTQLH